MAMGSNLLGMNLGMQMNMPMDVNAGVPEPGQPGDQFIISSPSDSDDAHYDDVEFFV